MTLHYDMFGLHVATTLPLPECHPTPAANQPPDVQIALGEVPASVPDATHSGVVYALNARHFRFALRDVAAYWVEAGTHITVAPHPSADPESVRVFLLGPVFGALLHQRGLVLLHASAMYGDRGAVLFLGDSPLGKSTLAAAFWQRGWRVLADDMVVLTQDTTGQVLAHPAYPHLALYPPMLRALGLNPDEHPRLRPTLEKRWLAVTEAYATSAQPVSAVYCLGRNPDATQAISINPLRGLQAFRAIARTVYHIRFMRGSGPDGRMMHMAKALTQQAAVRSLQRRMANESAQAVADHVEDDLRRL